MNFNKFKGKGYYIVLFLCVLAVGTAGYVTLQKASDSIKNMAITAEDVALPQVVSSNVLLPIAEQDAPVAAPDLEQSETEAANTAPEKPAPQPPAEQTPAKQEKPPEPKFAKPMESAVIQSYSEDQLEYSETFADWRCHVGVDYAANVGQQVSAIADGVVSDVYTDEVFGTVMEIEHENGIKSIYYGLMDATLASTGDKVSCGEVIGGVGEATIFENELPPHLHLEVLKNGIYINPESLFEPQ